MPEPLDRAFNVAVMHIASRLFPTGFDVSDQAPQTFTELAAHLRAGNRMIVWSGGSEHTIYADREVNYAFRAWHDWCHWRGEFDLSFDGEVGACDMQCRQLRELYGDRKQWFELVRAEVIGQAAYFRRHKRFPDNQAGFVAAYLSDAERALLCPFW